MMSMVYTCLRAVTRSFTSVFLDRFTNNKGAHMSPRAKLYGFLAFVTPIIFGFASVV